MRSTLALVAVSAALAVIPAQQAPAAAGCGALIQGTAASERLSVSAAANHVLGMDGNDNITGGAGRDCLDGGPGRDRVSGGGGRDIVIGGPGSDRLLGGGGTDRIDDAPSAYAYGGLSAGANHVWAGPGADAVNVANGRRDVVRCGSGHDRVSADRADTLIGCERSRVLASPFPSATPARGGRAEPFLIRFRAIEPVASSGEYFSIKVEGPPRCGEIEATSLGIRYRKDGVVRFLVRPFGGDGQRAKRWCRGRYRGTVSFEQVVQGSCTCTIGVRLGPFSFRVR